MVCVWGFTRRVPQRSTHTFIDPNHYLRVTNILLMADSTTISAKPIALVIGATGAQLAWPWRHRRCAHAPASHAKLLHAAPYAWWCHVERRLPR